MVEVECPDCGEMAQPSEIEEIDDEPEMTVARRSNGFSGNVTSLLELGGFGYAVEMPCGCKIYTVN